MTVVRAGGTQAHTGGTWAQEGPSKNTPSAWLSSEPTENKTKGQAGENRTVTLVPIKSRAGGNRVRNGFRNWADSAPHQAQRSAAGQGAAPTRSPTREAAPAPPPKGTGVSMESQKGQDVPPKSRRPSASEHGKVTHSSLDFLHFFNVVIVTEIQPTYVTLCTFVLRSPAETCVYYRVTTDIFPTSFPSHNSLLFTGTDSPLAEESSSGDPTRGRVNTVHDKQL